MRRVLIALATAGAATAFATPASAQYYPRPAYGAPYGNAYGYNYNNAGQARSLQFRVNAVQRQIETLRARRMITRNEASRLRSESRDLERRLYWRGANGLSYGEARDIQYRIARLEQHVRREVRDDNWNRGYGYNGYNGYNNRGGYDRDRDGRDDRYEDDHGYRHD